MSAVPERIGIMAARQGGFSVVQLPRPLELQWDGSFVFLPTKTGDTWQVTGGNSAYDSTEYDLVAEAPSPLLDATGGPYEGAPVLRNEAAFRIVDGFPVADSPSRRYVAADALFEVPAAAAGLTFEFYVDFGPDGAYNAELATPLSADVECYLTTAEASAEATPSRPYFLLQARARLESNSSLHRIQALHLPKGSGSAKVSGHNIGSSGGGATDETSTDSLGWNHYAGEIYKDGRFRLYYNGELVKTETLAEIDDSEFSDVSAFAAVRVNAYPSRPTARPYTSVHGVRYSPFIRYNGGNFTPPQL